VTVPLGRIVVVGLGPGDPSLLTVGTVSAIEAATVRFVRTTRHPSAAALGGATSFDRIYDEAPSLPEVYRRIVEELVEAAGRQGEVLYAVPGSPLVAERTVELLRRDERVTVTVMVAPSFVDLAWDRLAVDPVAAGVRIVDGHRFAVEAAGQTGPMLVAQCDSRQVLSDIKLSVEDGPEVTVLHHLGLPDESVTVVAWEDIDRVVPADHLTSVWVPMLAAPVAAELVRFDELVHVLRQRCPWDREQTHRSLSRHLLEETYETLEAISELDRTPASWDHLAEELGDLLFQVVFHATLAAEEGQFTLSDVARGIHDKLVGRHPHVFADVRADTPAVVMSNWEAIKQVEKGRASLMDGIPVDLPSLLYAHKVQRKASSVGFDWDSAAGAWAKVGEELAELRVAVERAEGPDRLADELGDVLFAVVNVARHLGVDPEAALRGAAVKFRGRFATVESLAADRGVELSSAGSTLLDELWSEAKLRPRS
jgi:tetrapyrrole methylase family protein/MazG family protein